jgi:NADH:ubiquinone oxidoreductase subunit D
MQVFPKITKGWMISDLIMVLGAIDFILADLDR